jgi:hypothetical protein
MRASARQQARPGRGVASRQCGTTADWCRRRSTKPVTWPAGSVSISACPNKDPNHPGRLRSGPMTYRATGRGPAPTSLTAGWCSPAAWSWATTGSCSGTWPPRACPTHGTTSPTSGSAPPCLRPVPQPFARAVVVPPSLLIPDELPSLSAGAVRAHRRRGGPSRPRRCAHRSIRGCCPSSRIRCPSPSHLGDIDAPDISNTTSPKS